MKAGGLSSKNNFAIYPTLVLFCASVERGKKTHCIEDFLSYVGTGDGFMHLWASDCLQLAGG